MDKSKQLTHLDLTGDGTVDEGGFVLLRFGDLLLLDGDGCVDFGGWGVAKNTAIVFINQDISNQK